MPELPAGGAENYFLVLSSSIEAIGTDAHPDNKEMMTKGNNIVIFLNTLCSIIYYELKLT